MNWSTFDLNLIRILDALMTEGSTVKAADKLGLSQPAVSAALGRLRHALDDPLFVRRGQGLEPTDYARAIALPLRETLERMQKALEGQKIFDPATADVTFKVSGSDFFAEMLMPPLAVLIGKTAPNVRVQLVDLVPDSYVETLDQYKVDLALIPSMAFPDWVEHRPVFHSDFVVIARSDHPRLTRLATDETMPIDLFCDLGHVLFSPEGNLAAMGDAALAAVGRQRRVVMTMPVFSGVYRAVSESDLIALIPEQLARKIAPKVGLTIYKPPMPITPALIEMIWHRRSTMNPAHSWLRDRIADVMTPLNAGHPPLQ